MLRFVAISMGLILMLALSGCAESVTHIGLASEPVAVKKAVHTYTLENGVRLLVKDTDKGTPTSIQLWVAGGNITDPPGSPGLSHFVEHMLLTGSEHLPPGRAEQYIESMGGRLVGNTGRDFSYIGVTIPGPGWERAYDILFDLAAHPAFNPGQLEKQRKVVKLEIGARPARPDVELVDDFFGLAYRKHPYKNPITGSAREVGHFTRDDVAAYYARTYVPSNMTVVVVGDVSPADARAAVEKTFGRLTPVKFALPNVPEEPGQATTRTKESREPVRMTYMTLGWHVAAAGDDDIYPLEVLSAVLGYGRGSRLYMELREREGIAFDVKAELFPLKDPGILAVYACTTKDNIEPVVDDILREVNRVKDEGISDSELRRAVGGIEAAYLLSGESAEEQAYALGYWATVYGGKDPGQYIGNIRKVTAQEVRRAAQKYLGEGNYTVYIIRPEKKPRGR